MRPVGSSRTHDDREAASTEVASSDVVSNLHGVGVDDLMVLRKESRQTSDYLVRQMPGHPTTSLKDS